MGRAILSKKIRDNYEIHERKHALAILAKDFPKEFKDITNLLEDFKLCRSWISTGGGGKSKVASSIDKYLYARGWAEKSFDISIHIDEETKESPTHKVDCVKSKVALEIEWNNKDPFFDRDLNNFRLLFDLGAISVGVIITRCDELQEVFDSLGRGASYGSSTTHMSKLLPKIDGGGAAGCPLLVFGITKKLYNEKC